jgi:hypothetical protein
MMKQAPRINVSPEEADGEYSNLVLVAFSKAEFVLDFARVMPGVNTAKIKARIILSPHKIKTLIKTLQGQVDSYEKAHGRLDEGESQSQIGFQNPVVIQEEPGRTE